MSPKKRSASRAACVEDVDEDTGSVLAGTAKYANTSQPSSPRREQSNIGKTRKADTSRRGRSPNRSHSYDYSEDESPIKSKMRPTMDKTEKPPRRLSLRPVHARQKPAPHVVQSATTSRPNESEYYGVPATSAHPDNRPPPRPRARTQAASMSRPPSFHGGDQRRPPASAYNRFSGAPLPPGPPGPPGPPPLPNVQTSFAPHSWHHGASPNYGPPPPMPRTPLEGPPNGYPFPPNPPQYPHNAGAMVSRARPHSSIGHRTQSSYDFDSAFGQEDIGGGPPPPPPPPASIARRPSMSQQNQRKREVRDRQIMPPPSNPQMRPQSAQPANALMFRLPPPDSPSNRKVNFDHSDDESFEYHHARDAAAEFSIPESRYLTGPPARHAAIPPTPSSRRLSITDRPASYAQPSYQTEVATSRRHRRQSAYGHTFGNSVQEESDESSDDGIGGVGHGGGGRGGGGGGSIDDINDQINKMHLYTKARAPPPPQPPQQRLTQGALHRVSHHGGASSRSTESSGSFNSEMPSHTTRTSHSNGDENGNAGVKIRGARRINVGGVEVELGGAEIEINPARKEHKGSYRDDSMTMYRGDRDSRRPRHEPPRHELPRHELPRHEAPRIPIPHRSGSNRAESFSRSRTAHPQLTSGYPPPPSQYAGYPSPAGDYPSPAPGYPSPAGPFPELEWQPSQQPWSAHGERYGR